jgi:hypothetical protein
MKRTKLLCLDTIRFFKDGQLILVPSDNLEQADSMVRMFKRQKNDKKYKTVIHRRTDDATFCLVLQWAHLINWIWAYPGTTEDTPVRAVLSNDRPEQISSRKVLADLQVACATIGSAW